MLRIPPIFWRIAATLAAIWLLSLGKANAQTPKTPVTQTGDVNPVAAIIASMDELRGRGELLDAEVKCLGAVKILEQQLAERSDDMTVALWCRCRRELGEVRFETLKVAEGSATLLITMKYLQGAMALRPSEPMFRLELAKTQRSLSQGFLHIKRYADAEDHRRAAVETLRATVKDFSHRKDFRVELATELSRHADILTSMARYPDADTRYKEALGLAEKLRVEDPASAEYANLVATILNSHAFLVRESGFYPESIDMMRTAIRLLRKIEADHPDDPRYWYPLPTFYRNIAQPLGYVHGDIEASHAIRDSIRLEQKLAQMPAARIFVSDAARIRDASLAGDAERLAGMQKEMQLLAKNADKNSKIDPDSLYARWGGATAKAFEATQLMGRGQYKEGLKVLEDAVRIMHDLAERHPEIPLLREVHSGFEIAVALLNRSQGEADAEKNPGHAMIVQWIARQSKFADDYPQSPEFRFHLSDKMAQISMSFANDREFKEANRYFQIGHDTLKRLAADFPTCPKYCRHYADGFGGQATMIMQLGDHATAIALDREGIREWQKRIADFPGNVEFRHRLASTYLTLAQHLSIAGKQQEADEAFNEMIRLDQKILEEHPNRTSIHFDLSRGYRSLGIARDRQDRRADAIECFSRAINLLDAGHKLHPRERVWVAELRAAVQQRSDAYLKSGSPKDYERDLERLQNIDEALDSTETRIDRVVYRSKSGNTVLALKDAEDLYQTGDLNAAQWVVLAAFFTEQSANAKITSQAEAFSSRAVTSLSRAVEQGASAPAIQRDPRFQPISDRGDFRKLTQK